MCGKTTYRANALTYSVHLISLPTPLAPGRSILLCLRLDGAGICGRRLISKQFGGVAIDDNLVLPEKKYLTNQSLNIPCCCRSRVLFLPCFVPHTEPWRTIDQQRPAGVATDAAVAIYPGPEAAFFAPFHSPPTVDHRVVRVNAVMTFIIAVFAAVFAGREATEWVVSCFVMWSLRLMRVRDSAACCS